MPKNSTTTSDPTLSKLLEVDAELATQETELLAQLQTLQEKRKSLQTVLGLFAPQPLVEAVGTPPAPALSNGQVPEQAEAGTVTPEPALEPEAPTAEDQEAASPEPVEALSAEEQQEAPAPRRGRATSNKQQPKTSKQPSQGKQKAPAKTGSRKESWRPYVREEFPSGAPLAEMVSMVLQRLPERSFTAPEILGAIFTEDIPQRQYDTAKGRLFTVLSNGVKENLWIRHDKGQYRAPA